MILGVDIGGTFTDAVLVADGTVHTAKVSTTPAAPADGVLHAIDAVLAKAETQAAAVGRFAHGMTVATNALLEGRWARTALVATEGFTDIVELARQARPSLYRLCERGPSPLAAPSMRFAAPERMGPDGPLRPLDGEAAAAMVARLALARPEAVAVVLLHSYAHPEHERELAKLIGERIPTAHVTVSHDLVGTFREYERAATTEVDAALSPLLAGYLGELASSAGSRGLPVPQVMQSSGGLIDSGRAAKHPSLTLLSGPAGGVRGAQLTAALAGASDVLCFDMGGTSCDVCLILNGTVTETAERAIGGRPLALPALDIHTVGAGGGSIAWRDTGGALRVGPRSAGAVPGPACYGRGGDQPTVTDANLVLGRLDDRAPMTGALTLDAGAARRAVGALGETLDMDAEACAEGIVAVAEAEMLRALRVVTVERGIDPRGLALLGFGGAGPLHAAAMAEALGIGRVICPRASGVLSALGLAAAGARCDAARTVMLSGAGLTATRVAAERDTLIEQATMALGDAAKPSSAGDGELTGAAVEVRVQYELRYRGQAFELAVAERECPDPEQMAAAFARAHRERYGYAEPEAPIELVTIRVSAFTAGPQLGLAAAGGVPCVRETRTVVIEGAAVKAQWLTGDPAAGTSVQGPAVFAMPQTTLLIPPGWNAQVDAQGSVTLDWVRPKRAPRRAAHREGRPDAVGLQVLCGALRATCEEMGAVLIRAAHSANIKERRDASTALFDADGQMVMQAEHIPVHLGAMPDAVAAVLAEKHRPGRSFILNDPFAGGTHLPDITVVTPVFCAEHLVGFAASRAHHADVGGRWPGSMPADSHTLQEEGVVISPQPITPDTIDRLVGEMRQPAERRADLRAQLAANTVGADRYAQLAQDTGIASLRAGTDAVLDYAERRTVACLRRLEGAAPGALPDTPLRDGNGAATWQAADVLETADGDLQLRLRATITGGRLVLDFAGSAPQHEGNLNCPAAVTRSACYFAMRVLTDPDIPPSAGAHRPIEVRAPLGSLLNAHPGAAVAAGNVETSSRVADLVLGAFGCALGQGTMNNLTLGNDHFTYYETVGGGQGACADADGPSAVHVAMSNTLNTPVEALERDFPMRVRRYEVRRGSGGSGKHSGGDGVVREIEALEPMRYSLIGERRRHAPRGAAGGGDGACGRNLLLGAATTGGEEREPEAQVLPAKATGTLAAGERLVAETPGGGGYGRAC